MNPLQQTCPSRLPALWCAACALLAPAGASTAADEPARPNVLLIAIDDLRPDLGCYGNEVAKTPHLDRLAARGVVFTNAHCQQAVCSPSRTSLMTGRRPDATRVWDLNTHFRVALPDAVTLPQHFKAHGYHCAALGKIYHHGFEDGRSWSEPHWYPNGTTIDTDPADWRKRITKRVGPGVQEYSPASRPPAGAARGPDGRPPKGLAFEASPKADDELPDGATAAHAVAKLGELKARGRPFFLAVGFLKPHLPFVAPQKYWDLHDPARIPQPATDRLPAGAPPFVGHDNGELHSYAGIPKGNPIPEDLARRLRHGYHACVSYVDAQVGRLLDALDQHGLADNTVVVLWGDHGWQLGDHGLWHKHTNFELATRAPLLISAPGLAAAGGKCAAPTEFVDIYPTLADVCRLPIPAGLDGASLKPWLTDPAAPMRKVALSQYPRGGALTGGRPLMGYSVRDDRWRLTTWRDRRTGNTVATELYDERDDPAETINLAENPRLTEVVERLSQHLPATTAPPPPAAKPAARPRQNRAALFASRDRNRDGSLTREEFLTNQPDPNAAAGRFTRWDLDRNGTLSRDEFIRAAAAKPR